MERLRLTETQLGFFHTFGFLRFPGLFAGEIAEISAEFEAVWERHGGGHDGRPHDGARRSCLFPFIDQSERLSALLDDPRVLGLADALVGADFTYMGSDGNYYVGDTRWHSDGAWETVPRKVKLAFYLDPLTRDTGCLRVLPGSHLPGDSYAETLQQQIRQSEELWGVPGHDLPALALETQPGDLLCFNHNLKHAAFGGGTRRRMFTLDVSQRYPEDRLDSLRSYIGTYARFFLERYYGDAMVRTASPERMRHLEQALANDGHLAALSRQERLVRPEPSRG